MVVENPIITLSPSFIVFFYCLHVDVIKLTSKQNILLKESEAIKISFSDECEASFVETNEKFNRFLHCDKATCHSLLALIYFFLVNLNVRRQEGTARCLRKIELNDKNLK